MFVKFLGKKSPSFRCSGISCPQERKILPTLVLLALTGGATAAPPGGVYGHKDENGNWVFTDLPPTDRPALRVDLAPGDPQPPGVDVMVVTSDGKPFLQLRNRYFLPVQVVAAAGPGASNRHEQVVASRQTVLLALPAGTPMDASVTHGYLLGDPAAEHRPPAPYRVPFAASTRHRVSQGFHGTATHTDEASTFAVDIAMPVGTSIVAAREGVVVEIAYQNYAGGTGTQQTGAAANLVRIAHDDGTYAVYAHLDRSSVRVRPGQRVARGEPIAASGNTGFSTGPHLHFAILRNADRRVVSVPFAFAGERGEEVTPRQGEWLTAYP